MLFNGTSSADRRSSAATTAEAERRDSQSSIFSVMSGRTSITSISNSNKHTSLTSGHRSSIDQSIASNVVSGKSVSTSAGRIQSSSGTTVTAATPSATSNTRTTTTTTTTTTSSNNQHGRKSTTISLALLPPDVTVRILHHLPIPALATMAQVSRRFKVLVNNEEIYIRKLKQMGLWQDLSNAAQYNGGLLDAPVAPIYISSDLTSNQSLMPTLQRGNNLLTDESATLDVHRARDQFKHIYRELIPYYVDLRHRHREPRIQSEFPDPIERARIIARLRRLMPVKVVDDYKAINLALETTTQLLESRSLQQFEQAYHADDTEAMKYHALVLFELNGGQSCVQMYIQMNQLFFDNEHTPLDNLAPLAVNEQGEHTPLIDFAEHLKNELERQAKMISEIFSEEDDVLFAFTERVYEDVIADYVNELMAGALQRSLPDYLNLTVEAYRRFSTFTVGLTQMRPRALDPERAHRCLYAVFSPLMEPYIEREIRALREMYDREIRRWDRQMEEMRHRAEAERTRRLMGAAEREAYKKGFLRRLKRGLTRSKDDEKTGASTNAKDDSSSFEIVQELSGLLSLEMSLQMIHVNKQALHRVLRFANLGGRAGTDVERGLERIFVSLLHILGQRHVKPAFETAVERLSSYKTTQTTASDAQVQPILRFFELIHLADLVHQMIFVYYKEEICRFVDEHDFTNGCNAEKKAFERNLDDVVAAGLDRSIEVLMSHVEYILENEQRATDYDPETDIIDLRPTKACRDVVRCLYTHTQMVSGATEKPMLEVFYTELGLRFFNILSKHLKTNQISEAGGFQVISDLNHYHEWAVSLNAPEALRYFHALKELGHIYIVSPQDLRELMHDRRRYQGALREEEIYEFVQLRKDYRRIQKVVESEKCYVM
ncbi:exocyst complex component Sec10-domain-containing protein [Syncephalis plumigaleata]|nr:exocyst complex component Sec10-domain-containing protein [Syncephalis plumigaleata]